VPSFPAIEPNIGTIVKLVWSQTNGWGVSESGQLRRRGKNGETVAESIKFGPLDHWVGFNLRMAQEAAFQAFSRRSQAIGESPGRFATLTLIARNPGISQTALSQASGRNKSSVTPVVEDLVRRGLVERKREHRDRRAYCLNLTPAGKKTLTELTRCARRHERNLDTIIGHGERKRFIAILKKIAADID